MPKQISWTECIIEFLTPLNKPYKKRVFFALGRQTSCPRLARSYTNYDSAMAQAKKFITAGIHCWIVEIEAKERK